MLLLKTYLRLRFRANTRRNYLTAKMRIIQRLLSAPFLILVLLAVSCSDQPPVTAAHPTSNQTAVPTKAAPPTKTPAPTTTPTQYSTFDLEEGDLRGQVVQFWYVLPEQVFQAAPLDPVREAVAAFNRANRWGIRVEASDFDSYEQLVDEVEAARYGDMPELITGYSFHLAHLDDSGSLLADLAPYVSDSIWGFADDERQDFYQVFWEQDETGGRRLGLPFYRSIQVLFYNRTWAGELDIDGPPQTPGDFQRQSCSAYAANRQNEEKPRGSGGWIVDTSVPAVLSWLYAFDGSISSSQQEGYRLDGEALARAFSFFRDMYESRCSWVPDEIHPYDAFARREALFITSGITGISSLEAALGKAGSSDNWAILPYPGASGKPAVDAYGPSLALIESPEVQQMAAWVFAKWLLSPENQAKLAQRTGTLPVRASAIGHMGGYLEEHPQWADALDLLEYARIEPAAPSWSIARWTLRDAAFELYRPSFSSDMIPDLVGMLRNTLNELEDLY